LGDLSEVGTDDVGCRAERIEHLSRSCDEGGGTPGAKCANDIPGMRGHEAQLTRGDLECLGNGAVHLGRRLEAANRVHRERSFE
jgi:hypothetical protein